ncbi:MAG: FmdB family zinc ribbon protein [Dehalococcoidia bacterium]
MPLYEYECISCSMRFDLRQAFYDEPVAFCPECDGKARRVIHSVAIHFKGSGFYSTDSRKSSASESTSTKEKKGEAAEKKGQQKEKKEAPSGETK